MNNKKNLVFFEGGSMKELYNNIEIWQDENQKRLLSINIQKENNKFSCIALTNPTEVVICDSYGNYIDTYKVNGHLCLHVDSSGG